MALRDTIRGAAKVRRAVRVSGWGVTVYARALSAAERLDWERRSRERKGPDGEADQAYSVALLLCLALEEEDGSPVFVEADDLAWLMHEAGAPDVFAAYDAVADLNALSRESREEVRKNSDVADPTGGGSPTNSPAPTAAST
jgi:hypothetical protein